MLIDVTRMGLLCFDMACIAYIRIPNLQFPTVTVCHGDDMQTVDSWTFVEKFYTMASSHELEDKV